MRSDFAGRVSVLPSLMAMEARLLFADPQSLIIMFAMPLVLIGFLKSNFRFQLQATGHHGANGAELAVPGMIVMFGFLSATYVGYAFFREHIWRTWDRLRASPTGSVALIGGKLLPLLLLFCLQIGALFVAGVVLYGLRVRGSVIGVAAITVGFIAMTLAFGTAAFAVCRTFRQLNAFVSFSSIVLAGIAGALVPFQTLPDWARLIAPATPGYWAMKGYRKTILDHGAISDAMGPTLALLGFALVFVATAALRFRIEDGKPFVA